LTVNSKYHRGWGEEAVQTWGDEGNGWGWTFGVLRERTVDLVKWVFVDHAKVPMGDLFL